MSSPAVLQKLEELRIQKEKIEEDQRNNTEKERIIKENELKSIIETHNKILAESKILWEAELLLKFESFNKDAIRNGFSSDKSIDHYISELSTKYGINMEVNIFETMLERYLLQKLSTKTESQNLYISENECKQKGINCNSREKSKVVNLQKGIVQLYSSGGHWRREGEDVSIGFSLKELIPQELYDCKMFVEQTYFKQVLARKLMIAILQPIQDMRDAERRKKEAEVQAQKNTEKLQRQIKAFAQLEKLATEHCSYTTYKPLKNIDYNSNFIVNVLKKNANSWYHYRLEYHGVSQSSGGGFCMTGLTPEMIDWYEKGLIPFCTRCPICQGTNKFNFLDTSWLNGYGDREICKSPIFTEVYCPNNHYFYDCQENIHYIVGGNLNPQPKRNKLSENRRYVCWNPQHSWKIWDPQDHDGSKQKELERQKEKQDLQNQIALLQQKLKTV